MQREGFIVSDVSEIPQAASRILQVTAGHKVFAITGQMGAGKTTLVKELCRQLGSADNFSSPTYSIVNEYAAVPTQHSAIKNQQSIYHIDLYRLNTIQEALDIGIEDYISGNSYCFIEWPDLIETLLPEDVIRMDIQMRNNTREIAIFMR